MTKHNFRKDEFDDEKIDTFAASFDVHNGPICEVCGACECIHCKPEFLDEECPGPDRKMPTKRKK